jgi:hypothetical protein
VDVTFVVKYTAEQGGETFASAVKGMRKPYATAAYIDVAATFPDAWNAFTAAETSTLELPLTEDHLPGIAGRQVTAVYARYDHAYEGETRFLLNGDRRLALDDGKQLRTPGLAAGGWTLAFEGDRAALAGLGLVVSYRAL